MSAAGPRSGRCSGSRRRESLFFTISIPVEVVFAEERSVPARAGTAALLSAWGAGAVRGSLAFGRWRHLPVAELISFGAAALGAGFVVMAAAPALGMALAGAALGGKSATGCEAVAGRTAVQENVESQWMAMIMSVNESVVQIAPGVGIVLGGAITAIADPGAVALAVAAGRRPLRSAGLIRVPSVRSRSAHRTHRSLARTALVSRSDTLAMRRACIDIGIEHDAAARRGLRRTGGLPKVRPGEGVHAYPARDASRDGGSPDAKIAEVVASRRPATADGASLGSTARSAVATAAIRRAANGPALLVGDRERCGLEVVVLTGERGGAAGVRRRGRHARARARGELGVVDVGGGSSELVVGTAPDTITWCTSFAIGIRRPGRRLPALGPAVRAGAERRPGAGRPGAQGSRRAASDRGGCGRGQRRVAAAAGRADARRRGVQAIAGAARAPRRRSTWPSGSRSTWNGCGCCRPGC